MGDKARAKPRLDCPTCCGTGRYMTYSVGVNPYQRFDPCPTCVKPPVAASTKGKEAVTPSPKARRWTITGVESKTPGFVDYRLTGGRVLDVGESVEVVCAREFLDEIVEALREEAVTGPMAFVEAADFLIRRFPPNPVKQSLETL